MNDLISRASNLGAVALWTELREAMALDGHVAPERLGPATAKVIRQIIADAQAAASQPEAGWTGMGGGIAPKLDPDCGCVCHRQPGVMHVAPCCQSQPEAEPVAWRWHWNGGDEPDVWAYCEDRIESDQHRTAQPLYTHPTPAPVVPAEGLERAREDEAKAGWTMDMELLKELRSAAGDWGYSLDLEAVEAIALEVEKRLRAQQPAALGEDAGGMGEPRPITTPQEEK